MISVGVIGCGYWGPNLIRNFFEVADVNMIMCCDLRQDRVSLIRAKYPSIKMTTFYKDVLHTPGIDAVAIATPITSHFQLAKEALENDKHVLVEKPLTSSVREAEILIELANRRKKILMVGHTFEYNGTINKIKEIVSKGEIGDIYYFDSVRINLGLFQHDINVLWDLAPHDFSIIRYILGRDPISVSAIGRSHISEGIENIAYVTLGFEDNLIAHCHFNWLAPVKMRHLIICGSKKMIILDDIEPSEKIKIYDKGVNLLTDHKEVERLKIEYRIGDMYAPKFDTTEALRIECTHFIDCIKQGKKPCSDGESGLRVVKILSAAQRSLENNGQTEVIEPS